MKAYVINLSSRSDRWESVLQQRENLGIEVVRVEAVTTSGLDSSVERYVAPGVSATWASHKLAMRIFLESGEKFGLIMEDDFFLTKHWSDFDHSLPEQYSIDFLQLGFLRTSTLDLSRYILDEIWDLMLKSLSYFRKFSLAAKLSFFQRRLILEQEGIPFALIPNNIRAGGQGYIVSRKFALASSEMNTPAFNSTDGFYISLGDVRTFRMYRMRRNIIRQTDSLTSVDKRYL